MNTRSLAALVVITLVASACGSANSEGEGDSSQSAEVADTPDTTEAAIVETTTSTFNEYNDPDVLQALNLTVGDCFQSDWADSFHTDELVDCAEPHDGEVFAIIDTEVDTLSDSYGDVAHPLCTTAYVQAMGHQFVEDPGPLMGFVVDGGPNDVPVSGLVCILFTELDDAFVGSFFTADTASVFDGYVSTTLMTAGDCFGLVDQFNVGRTEECGPNTLVALGIVDAATRFPGAEFPGVDALSSYRSEVCIPLLDETGIVGNPAEVSGVIPDELDWNVYGMTLISCDVPWIEDYPTQPLVDCSG